MWVWMTLFLITAGIGLIGFGQSTVIVLIGVTGLITGVTTMIYSMKDYEEV